MTDPRFDDFDAGIQAEEFYSIPDGWDAIEADDPLGLSDDPYADMSEEEIEAELAWLDDIDDRSDYQNEWELDQKFDD